MRWSSGFIRVLKGVWPHCGHLQQAQQAQQACDTGSVGGGIEPAVREESLGRVWRGCCSSGFICVLKGVWPHCGHLQGAAERRSLRILVQI